MTKWTRIVAARAPDPLHDTESRISAIRAGAGAQHADWAREMAELLDPVGERNAAVRRAAALLGAPRTTAAKLLATALAEYLARAWPRERIAGPAPGASALRVELYRIAKLTNGAGLAWRRLADLID